MSAWTRTVCSFCIVPGACILSSDLEAPRRKRAPREPPDFDRDPEAGSRAASGATPPVAWHGTPSPAVRSRAAQQLRVPPGRRCTFRNRARAARRLRGQLHVITRKAGIRARFSLDTTIRNARELVKLPPPVLAGVSLAAIWPAGVGDLETGTARPGQTGHASVHASPAARNGTHLFSRQPRAPDHETKPCLDQTLT